MTGILSVLRDETASGLWFVLDPDRYEGCFKLVCQEMRLEAGALPANILHTSEQVACVHTRKRLVGSQGTTVH
jgi:hypothetical protein